MRGRDILSGQWLDPATAQRAYQLRHGMTDAEQMLWQSLRANRLHGFHFRRQQIVSGFIVDFYCHAAHLAVEVDGAIHQEQLEADRERDLILTALGLQVLHITNDEVSQELDKVLDHIYFAICSSPCSPFPRGEGG
jgi:very-short-patch-repair endonuclease